MPAGRMRAGPQRTVPVPESRLLSCGISPCSVSRGGSSFNYPRRSPQNRLASTLGIKSESSLRNEFGSVALHVAPGEPDSFPLASYLEESACFDTDFAVSRAALTAATPRSFAACAATPAAFFRSELRSFTSFRLRVAAAFFAEALRWAFVCLLNLFPFGRWAPSTASRHRLEPAGRGRSPAEPE